MVEIIHGIIPSFGIRNLYNFLMTKDLRPSREIRKRNTSQRHFLYCIRCIWYGFESLSTKLFYVCQQQVSHTRTNMFARVCRFWNSYSIGLDRVQNCVIQITSNLVATKYTLIQYLYFPLLLSFIWKVSASMLDDMLPNETICDVYLKLETMTSFVM